MDILGTLKKKMEGGVTHTTPQPAGHTLAEILKDKKNSLLFGDMLRVDGDEDLAQKIVRGELEDSDVVELEKRRARFSEKITESEKIEKLITNENIVEFARRSKDFEQIVNILGPEKATKVIKEQLKELSIKDEGRFGGIVSNFETMESYEKGAYKDLNERAKKMCEDGQFTDKEYLAATDITDPQEREAAIKDLAKRKYGLFRRGLLKMGIANGKFISEVRNMQATRSDLENAIADLDTQRETIGSVLFLGVKDNDDMRGAMARELLGEKIPPEPKPLNFVEARKQAEAPSINDADFQIKWADYKDNMSGGLAAYNALAPADQDLEKDKFLGEQKRRHQQKMEAEKGWWYSLLMPLFEWAFDDKKASLT